MTYKSAENLRESLKILPIEKLLVETDAPYLSPQGHR
ncbi:TatD family hydrolase [bacterium]|nr:TatD family hydrolase [bacterium]